MFYTCSLSFGGYRELIVNVSSMNFHKMNSPMSPALKSGCRPWLSSQKPLQSQLRHKRVNTTRLLITQISFSFIYISFIYIIYLYISQFFIYILYICILHAYVLHCFALYFINMCNAKPIYVIYIIIYILYLIIVIIQYVLFPI